MADILWCCHVWGPDDVYAERSYDDAVKHADDLNRVLRDHEIKNPHLTADENWPWCRAYPAPWPWSAEEHAEALAKATTPIPLAAAG